LLKKEREDRYQSVAEVRTALEKVAASGRLFSRRVHRTALVSLAILFIAASIVTIRSWRRPLATRAFQKYEMKALTSTGDVVIAAISSNGKYLAYTKDEVGKSSAWVEELATSSTAKILGPVTTIDHLTFAPDGNSFYYSRYHPDSDTLNLDRLSLLGGSPESVIADVDTYSSVGFSPGGQRIAFSRHNSMHNEDYLLTANPDGTAETRILTLKGTKQIGWPVWSPDGKIIAFGVDETGTGVISSIGFVSSEGGKERRLRNLL
jgi:Tol biopolymer transport system component